MKHTAIITSNTKLPKGWTYKDGNATNGKLTITSKETYTLAQKRKDRMPFYRIAVPITRHNILGELKHVHNYHDLTIKEAEAFSQPCLMIQNSILSFKGLINLMTFTKNNKSAFKPSVNSLRKNTPLSQIWQAPKTSKSLLNVQITKNLLEPIMS